MTRHKTAIDIARTYPGMPALIRAIEICGSRPLLAGAIGVKPALISSWLNVSHTVPLEVVPLVVAVADDPDVTPLTLRPDFAQGWALLARQLRSLQDRREPDREPEALTE